ncbi:MAG: hypothetical protein FWC97_10770, partial [Treponema sp.]|nr:hypothetical protein [Treponema sp.]
TNSAFDVFTTTGATSVEYRYSQGIFTSMVDDFIDVNHFGFNGDEEGDGQGTFFFLGGFPDATLLGNNVLNFGFAHTFGFGYLAMYYRGNFVETTGTRVTTFRPHDDATPPPPPGSGDFNNRNVFRTWQNRFAALYGTDTIGAFRLDLIWDATGNIISRDGDDTRPGNLDLRNVTRTGERAFAFSWGGMDLFGFEPSATIGFALPNRITTSTDVNFGTPADPDLRTDETENISGGEFGLQLGVFHTNTGLWGDLSVFRGFRNRISGTLHWEDINGIHYTTTESTGGGFTGVAFRAGYLQTFEMGQLSFGFQPIFQMGFVSRNQSFTSSLTNDENPLIPDTNIDQDEPSIRNFEVRTDVALGLRFQATERFAFYTGATFQLFQGLRERTVGGSWHAPDSEFPNVYIDTRADVLAWWFNGFQWISPDLRLGMTFTPMENLIIAAGIESFTDKLFNVNMADMEAGTGTFFNSRGANGANNIGDWATYLFRNLQFNLTVSFRM